MTQSSLFQFFNPKNKNSAVPTSPATKKAAVIKSLKKVAKIDDDDDFNGSDLDNSSDEDEKEFDKVVTAKKVMSSNKGFLDSDDYDDEDFDDLIEDEDDSSSKSNKKRVKAPNTKKATPKTSRTKKNTSTSASSRSVSPSPSSSSKISPSTSMTSLSAAANIDDFELPTWLTTNLRDAKKRPVTDPNYDPTTVFIPQNEYDHFTPFQKQFWDIKRTNFDSIVMIRKGKFYEMFNIDAIFVRDKLKLKLTNRGKEPMCGIPDKYFSEWALKIINAGKRVCKVEQMETAIDQRNRKGGEKAIKRELVQIYSLGTIDDFEMLESSQPSYLMSIRSSRREIAGVCLVDCSTGSFHIGTVNEDDLMDILIRFEPVEVVYGKDTLCAEHLEVVKRICGSSTTHVKSGTEWDPQLALNAIQRIAGWNEVPEFLTNAPKEAVAALGGCVAYLNDHKIAKSLLSLQRFSALDEAGGSKFLSLDSSALTNLQIIGNESNCLLNIIDRCSTSFGKRRLRFWIMHPLRNITAIEQRLDAVDELKDPQFLTLPKNLQSFPDLERILARVYSNRCSVKIFLDCLAALESAAEFIKPLESTVKCTLLKNTIARVQSSKLLKSLNKISNSVEKEKSIEENELIVKAGCFKDVDEIEEEVKDIERKLNKELDRIKKKVGCNSIQFYHRQSERYLVQIPISYTDDLDDDFVFHSQTKTCKRYRTPEVKELLTELENVENERLKLRSGCQKRFIEDFTKHSAEWDLLVDSIADLDCLLSLSAASQSWKQKSCRPKFITKDSPEANGHAYINIKEMSHPCIQVRCIPNDILLADKYVLLITGPNASGKSTFARTCCVAIILAQLGCYLPAESATLTIFDQIFTRIGAGDRLFSGQSTFAVELSETARLMRNSTSDSFVVLDELGRGTSTFDGISIASAVLEYFINEKKCPLVFCTHYHILTQQFQGVGPVRNVSMKYAVTPTKLLLEHKLIDGPCSSSFGCAVAKMCGLDKEICDEAQKIADDFEARHKALHLSNNECQITQIELRPELKKVYDDIKGAMEMEGSQFMKMAKLEEVFKQLPQIYLG
ncbi:DNA mismatch repair protein [Tritrichomonas musculus]|uniref:DNA mismatch repair protein n=1 Tax=Tritrichomonas musculus TaxID=1915356 RepID=A0ABR2GS28_9EUKA